MVKTIKVLDNGYVRLVEAWGHGDVGDHELPTDNECGIIEAARQSTQGNFRGWEQDNKLLKFLHSNKHDTPFEFSGMVIEVQAPIFVFREWHRHRVQSQCDNQWALDNLDDTGFNEMSGRYAPIPNLNYIPSVERILVNSTVNKQAGSIKGSEELTQKTADQFRVRLQMEYKEQEEMYQWALSSGIPKELARLMLPVGRYSRMRAVTNLRNWLAFIDLRSASNAQLEIQDYSNAVGSIVAKTFPHTWALYLESKNK